MRSSAKYRPFEISHVSVGDYFAAMQIVKRSGVETFGGFAAQSYQFPNYSIFQMNQLRALNARISIKKTRLLYQKYS